MFKAVQSLSAIVVLGASPSTVIAQEPSDIVSAFHEAVVRQDTAAALNHLDPGVIIFESGGAEMSRDEFQSHHLGADMAYAAATNREVTGSQTNVAGDVAFVLNRTRTTGRYGEREINSTGVETVILERKTGAWKIVHIHWSSRRR